MEFWQQLDGVGKGVAAVLVVMSVLSWYVMLERSIHLMQGGHGARERFVQAVSADVSCHDGVVADSATHIGLGDFVRHACAYHMGREMARLESGLTRLAAVGATAPFVGLLGTVWGVQRALANLSGHDRLSMAMVAGPVSEALVMTAAGLAVAIPAVLAYNALVRMNRRRQLVLAEVAHGLFVDYSTGTRSTVPPQPMPARQMAGQSA